MSHAAPSSSKRRGLASRLVVAAIALTGVAALAWADVVGVGGTPPMSWLLPVAVAAAGGCGLEAVRLAATRGLRLDGRVVSVGATAIAAAPALAAWIPAADAAPLATLGWAAAACGLVIVVVFAVEVARYAPGDGGLERVAGHIAAVVAIGLPLSFMVGLRLLAAGPTRTLAPLCGLVPIVSLIAVVKAGDVAAYIVGTLVGRHRMAPQLSPGKTWEGAAGSLAASVAVAWLVIGRGGFPSAPLGGWAVYGLLVGLAGMLGDLSESLVKRECGAKDSGQSLGGMGGFLDFVDSLLLAAPVAWMLWAAG